MSGQPGQLTDKQNEKLAKVSSDILDLIMKSK